MATRRFLAVLLLRLVSVLALLVALVAAMNAIGCCAIDCSKYPEKCAENRRRQESASVVTLAAFVASAAAMAGSIRLRRRG